MNIKNCGRRNIRKDREIKDSENYITLYILFKFVSLDKIIITSSEPKDYLGIPGKGLMTSLGLNKNIRPNKIKRQGMPLILSLESIFQILSRSLKLYFNRVMHGRGPNMNPLTVTFI